MGDEFHVCMYVYRRAVEAEHRRLTKIKNRANRKSVAHVQELEKKLMGKVLGRHTAKIPAHGDHYLQSGMGIRSYLCICMYACMYVRMYVYSMYVCTIIFMPMYVYMYLCMQYIVCMYF